MAESDVTAGAAERAGWGQGVMLAIVNGMMSLCVICVVPIVPNMLREFSGRPHADMKVTSSIVLPMLMLALAGPPAGAIGDRIGRRRLLNISTLMFSVFAIMPYWLHDLNAILVTRAIAGVALGGMLTSAVGLIGDYYSGQERQRWLAAQGVAGAVGVVVAGLVSGFVAEINWRLPFLTLAVGFLLFAGFVIFPGPANAQHAAQSDDAPAGDKTAVRWGRIVAVFAIAVVASLTVWPVSYTIGLILQDKALGSTVLAGLLTSVIAVGGIIGATTVAFLKRLSFPAKQAIAFAVCAVGTAFYWTSTSVLWLVVGGLAVGIGIGATFPIVSAWLLEETPPRLRGRIVGLFQSAFFLAQFACPLLVQMIGKGVGSTTAGSMLYYAAACALMSVAMIVCANGVRGPASANV